MKVLLRKQGKEQRSKFKYVRPTFRTPKQQIVGIHNKLDPKKYS